MAAARSYRRAWWHLTLYPLSLLLALGVGVGIVAFRTDDPEHAAFWQGALTAVPALMAFVIPGMLAFFHSRTAERLGCKAVRVPAVIGTAIGGAFVATNLAAFLWGDLTVQEEGPEAAGGCLLSSLICASRSASSCDLTRLSAR